MYREGQGGQGGRLGWRDDRQDGGKAQIRIHDRRLTRAIGQHPAAARGRQRQTCHHGTR